MRVCLGGGKRHYLRTKAGAEVDFIVARGRDLIPIEVKWTDNPFIRSDSTDTTQIGLKAMGPYRIPSSTKRRHVMARTPGATASVPLATFAAWCTSDIVTAVPRR